MAATLLEDLDLRGATFVVHDWGGPIGLRLAVEHPDRVDRIVMMDTGLFTGASPMGDEWQRFRDFVDRIEDLPMLAVQGGCHTRARDEVAAGYETPFPNPPSKAGMRAFPGLIPQTPDAPGAARGPALLQALRERRAAELCCGARSDFVLPPSRRGVRRRARRSRARDRRARATSCRRTRAPRSAPTSPTGWPR